MAWASERQLGKQPGAALLLLGLGCGLAGPAAQAAAAPSAVPSAIPSVVSPVVATASPAGEPSAAVLLVRPGDSFSALAASLTGSLRTWRRLYSARHSGLPDPARLEPGMRLQLVADGQGGHYLKLLAPSPPEASPVPPAAVAAVAAPPPPPPADPSAAPKPAPAPDPAPAANFDAASALPEPRDSRLVIGVLPHIEAALLVQRYDLMRRYLERSGAAAQVRVVVPTSFQAFFDALWRGDFDLAVAAPHMARVAQLDRQLVPLLSFEPRLDTLLLSGLHSSASAAAELRGQAVAFAHPQSLVALYGLRWFEQQGLAPGRDFEVKAPRSDLGVGRMVLVGEAAAAVMSQGEFRALPAEERSRLRILAVLASVPNFIVVAHPRLGQARQAQLGQLLKSFMIDPGEGAEFARATGLAAMVDCRLATLRELDPFVAATRRVLGR